MAEMKACGFKTVDKLKLEIELLQTKQLLLNDLVESRVKRLYRSEQDFTDFYDSLKTVCSSDGVGIEDLTAQLRSIKVDLMSCMMDERNPKAVSTMAGSTLSKDRGKEDLEANRPKF